MHRDLNIAPALCNAGVEDLIKVVKVQHEPVRVQKQLLARMAPPRSEVIRK